MYILYLLNHNNRQGHGFILETNMKFAGYVNVAFILDIVTFLSSNGPLKTSKVFLWNSAISSKNNTP